MQWRLLVVVRFLSWLLRSLALVMLPLLRLLVEGEGLLEDPMSSDDDDDDDPVRLQPQWLLNPT
jgi:hypothetical protein